MIALAHASSWHKYGRKSLSCIQKRRGIFTALMILTKTLPKVPRGRRSGHGMEPNRVATIRWRKESLRAVEHIKASVTRSREVQLSLGQQSMLICFLESQRKRERNAQ